MIKDYLEKQKPIIIALGGSIIVPQLSNEQSVDIFFLTNFKNLIQAQLKKGRRFIIVAGGGRVAKVYQKAIRNFEKVKKEDIDWLGIYGTKLNAYFLEAIFRNEIGDKKSLIIVGGTKPGWSTDFVAISLAKKYRAKETIIATNVPFIYDKDPNKFQGAKPIKRISFEDYKKLIPEKWIPGMNLPFDPVAARLAQKLKLKVKVLRANDFKNFKRAIDGKDFQGSIITEDKLL